MRRGRWIIGISGSLICSKTLMELIFPCNEFWWSPEGPVSQINSPHPHVEDPGIFSDLLRSVQMLKRESGVRKSTGSYRICESPVKLQPWFLSLLWKACLWTELQPWFLRLQWKAWWRLREKCYFTCKVVDSDIHCYSSQRFYCCSLLWRRLSLLAIK